MIRPGGSLSEGERLDADVCVVGAGPAGLTVADTLLGSGLRVLLVESGSAKPPVGGEAYEPSPSTGLPCQLEESRARGVGGSANRWDIVTPAGKGPRVRLRELDALDFEDRPGVRTPGWPLSRNSIESYYGRARRLFGLQPARCHEDQHLGNVAVQRTFSFGPASVFTSVVPARLEGDASTTILTDAVVTELQTEGPGSPVTSLRGRSRQGRAFAVHARCYVLAGGGVENPRLLLASRATTPAGLGNEHGHVGRYFMAHPHYTSGVLVPRDRALLQRPDEWDIVLRDRYPVQRKYALSEDVQRSEGLLNISYFIEPRPARSLVPLTPTGRGDARAMSAVRHVRRVVRTRQLAPGAAHDLATLSWAAPLMGAYWLRQQRARRAGSRGRPVFTLGAMAEQVPHADSRVRLATEVDSFGVPKAEMVWRVDSVDADAMKRTHDLLAPTLSHALGARVVDLLSAGELPGLGTGAHHMGTTRMSLRPEQGVVDTDSRVHGVANLFVAGSSVFPAGGSSNPTLTIVALAMRLGELISKELRPAEVQP